MTEPQAKDPVITKADMEQLGVSGLPGVEPGLKVSKAIELFAAFATMGGNPNYRESGSKALAEIVQNPRYRAAAEMAIENVKGQATSIAATEAKARSESGVPTDVTNENYATRDIALIRKDMAAAGVVQTHHDIPNTPGAKLPPQEVKR